MATIQPYLFLILLGSFVGCAAILLPTFTCWICMLETSIDIHAPLAEGPSKIIHRDYCAGLRWSSTGQADSDSLD
jgi:hypothetical protein